MFDRNLIFFFFKDNASSGLVTARCAIAIAIPRSLYLVVFLVYPHKINLFSLFYTTQSIFTVQI